MNWILVFIYFSSGIESISVSVFPYEHMCQRAGRHIQSMVPKQNTAFSSRWECRNVHEEPK